MLPIYFKFSLMMDTFEHLRWTFVSFAFSSIMLYIACIDILTWFGVQNIEFYKIMVIKDSRERKIQPVGALAFIFVQVMVLWALCTMFKQKEMYYVCNVLLGYFIYRLWAFLTLKTSFATKCFPFANFSSVSILFLFTVINDVPQIYQFLCAVFKEGAGMTRLDLIILNYRE